MNVKTKTGDVVVVHDLSGKIIFSDSVSSELTKIDLSLFEDGVYFVTILSDGNSVTEKLIKR
ncbi:MAG: T9SS type A sorting domain-containing protein [Crocinitomicaceae bacterium]|nr:T9SS type A sorting domain-containing protein [Crocinitomicaceae bacterium]